MKQDTRRAQIKVADAIDVSELTRIYSGDGTGTRLERRAIAIIKTSHKEEIKTDVPMKGQRIEARAGRPPTTIKCY